MKTFQKGAGPWGIGPISQLAPIGFNFQLLANRIAQFQSFLDLDLRVNCPQDPRPHSPKPKCSLLIGGNMKIKSKDFSFETKGQTLKNCVILS